VAASAQGLPARREGSTFAYLVLLTVGALDAAGYSIIAPVAPAIARSTGAGPGLIGVLVASFPLGIAGGSVLAAVGIKRGRTTTVLTVSLMMLALGSRSIMGLGSGGAWLSVTFGTLERWPGQEYQCMSRILAAYAAGGLIGPVLGSFGGIARPFAVFAGLVLVAAVLVLVMGESDNTRSFDTDRSALRLPGFWLASAGVLFGVLGLGMVEGVLPLHFGSELSQTGIGVLYAAMSVVVAASSALAARFHPRHVLAAAVGLVVVGIAAAGMVQRVPIWVAALTVAGTGIGLANTGSIGLLLEGVPMKRIVTAMVVWSQLGIVGYFIGPLAGGFVAETAGYAAIGFVPLVAAIPVVLLMTRLNRPT
jgi:MFS family permease